MSKISLNSLLKRKIFLTATGLFFIFFSVVVLALIYTHDQKKILEGITIAGISIGNLTQDEAKILIENEAACLLNHTIKLNVGQHSPEVKLEDLGLVLNVDLAVQQAYDIGRTGSIYKKIMEKRAAKKGIDIIFPQQWDELKLKETLDSTFAEFSNPAIDATFEITKENTMLIHKEQVGLIVDSEELASKIKEININKLVSEFKVEFKEQFPLVTADQLEEHKITGLLAKYTTWFDPSQVARSDNVRLAAKALDMAIIKPGDTLSFNQIVGERTVEGGYKDALIIVNGAFVPGLAGGICQVSSTLYNAGLLANLAVTQRSNHNLAIAYVPLGQDATVAYPDLDLKFNNNSGGYLLIRTKAQYNSVTIEIYGKVKPGQQVFITNTIVSTIPAPIQRLVDETLAPGESILKQKGQPGYHVKSIRTVKVNGVIVTNEPLQESHYVPLPKIYAVGPQ
ncbi:MAG: VanW family protein [Desulfosporosinus sp.]|jgi:vancomycin resistance protein YoaR